MISVLPKPSIGKIFSLYCLFLTIYLFGFLGGRVVKESACQSGDMGLIPGSGRSPAGGNGNPLQYSSLDNPMDRGVWQATVHGVAKSQTGLNVHLFILTKMRGM